MTPTRDRITSWLTYLVPISVLTLVIWAPDVFDLVLAHIRRYSLELALPAFTHGYMLWRVWLYRGRTARLLKLTCSTVSVLSAVSLYGHFTFTVFGFVTGVPALYAVALVILEQREREGRNA